MNVIAPVPQFQPSSDSTQFKPSSASDSSSQGVGGQDFSSALHAANSKPTRKSSTTKTPQGSHGGSQLPASGNPSPAALPPSAAAPAAAANAGSKAPTPDAQPAVPVGSPVAPSTTAVTGPIAAQAPAGPPTTPAPTPAPAPAAAAAATPFAQLIGQDAANPTPPVTADASHANAASPATGALPGASALPPLVLPPDAVAVADPNIAGDPVAAAAATALASTAADATTSNAALSAADKSAAAVSAAIALPVQPQPKVAATATATGNGSAGAVRAANSNATAGSAGTASSDAASATDAAAQSVMAAAAAARAAHGSSSDNVPAQTFLGAADSAAKPADASPPAVMPPLVAAAAGVPVAAAAAVANAAANARAITALADMSAAMGDKPSHENSADSSVSATSNDGSVGAAQLLTSNISTDTPTAPTFKVAAPVETSEFSQGVSDRVSFMVDGNISSAKLQVNPPALGPIEVRIALQGAHAQVTFTSHSALTRDALESSAPKLREMLGGQGFAQVSVDVSQGSFQDRSAQSSPYQGAAASARETGIDAAQPATRTAARVATGVLDAYA
jgi:flagellar hook-length control protein FliK